MSINVTVTGNPVSIKRGKMVSANYDSAKNDFEKRRLMRIEQVRAQSKKIAQNLRKSVQKENLQSACLESDGKKKIDNWRTKKLLEVQNQYEDSLDDIVDCNCDSEGDNDNKEQKSLKEKSINRWQVRKNDLKTGNQSKVNISPTKQKQVSKNKKKTVKNLKSNKNKIDNESLVKSSPISIESLPRQTIPQQPQSPSKIQSRAASPILKEAEHIEAEQKEELDSIRDTRISERIKQRMLMRELKLNDRCLPKTESSNDFIAKDNIKEELKQEIMLELKKELKVDCLNRNKPSFFSLSNYSLSPQNPCKKIKNDTKYDIPHKPKTIITKLSSNHSCPQKKPVKVYDHSSKTSVMEPCKCYCDKLDDGNIKITPTVSEDELFEEDVAIKRNKQAKLRGKVACDQEKCAREFRELERQLGVLQKKERVNNIFCKDRDQNDYHKDKDRLEEEKIKQQNILENAYENLFGYKKPAVVTLPKICDPGPPIKEKATKIWDTDIICDENSDNKRVTELAALLSTLQQQKEALIRELATTPAPVEENLNNKKRQCKKVQQKNKERKTTKQTNKNILVIESKGTQTSPNIVVEVPKTVHPTKATTTDVGVQPPLPCEIRIKIENGDPKIIDINPKQFQKNVKLISDHKKVGPSSQQKKINPPCVPNFKKPIVTSTTTATPSPRLEQTIESFIKNVKPVNQLPPSELIKYVKKLLDHSGDRIRNLPVSSSSDFSIETDLINTQQSEDIKQCSSSTPKVEEKPISKNLNNALKQYDEVVDNCTEKIRQLSQMIENTRKSQEKILKATGTDENLNRGEFSANEYNKKIDIIQAEISKSSTSGMADNYCKLSFEDSSSGKSSTPKFVTPEEKRTDFNNSSEEKKSDTSSKNNDISDKCQSSGYSATDENISSTITSSTSNSLIYSKQISKVTSSKSDKETTVKDKKTTLQSIEEQNTDVDENELKNLLTDLNMTWAIPTIEKTRQTLNDTDDSHSSDDIQLYRRRLREMFDNLRAIREDTNERDPNLFCQMRGESGRIIKTHNLSHSTILKPEDGNSEQINFDYITGNKPIESKIQPLRRQKSFDSDKTSFQIKSPKSGKTFSPVLEKQILPNNSFYTSINFLNTIMNQNVDFSNIVKSSPISKTTKTKYDLLGQKMNRTKEFKKYQSDDQLSFKIPTVKINTKLKTIKKNLNNSKKRSNPDTVPKICSNKPESIVEGNLKGKSIKISLLSRSKNELFYALDDVESSSSDSDLSSSKKSKKSGNSNDLGNINAMEIGRVETPLNYGTDGLTLSPLNHSTPYKDFSLNKTNNSKQSPKTKRKNE